MATTTELRNAHAGIVRLVTRDLDALWGSLNLSDPEAARDVLVDAVPALTTTYGESAAVVAADWYDELRASEGIAGRFRAGMAEAFPAEYVQRRVRYGAGHLFTDTPEAMLPFLRGAVQGYVLQPGRDTIQQAAMDDPQAAGWHRETSPGACDFCRMLAGRGGVYRESTAHFASHDDCNCVARPSWDANAPEVPVEAYRASERMGNLRERAAAGDSSAQSQLERQRAQTRDYIERRYS